MTIVRDADVNAFLEATSPLLYASEAEYGLMLGLAEGLQRRPMEGYRPTFLRAVDENKVTLAAFIQTRVENGIITHARSSEIDLFVEQLVREREAIKGIVGPSSASRKFAECFAKTRGTPVALAMAQKILELREVIRPRSCRGRFVQATLNEVELVSSWLSEFEKEAIPHNQRDRSELRKLAEAKIANGDFYLWEVEKQNVAMAATGRPTKTGISVNAVYTPQPHRGHGYASNLVARISQKMIDEGRSFCALYTDASNPTSNKIYQAIGYEIIGESAHYLF
jgi:predicted GNAT family acetyltransferase